MLRVLGLTRAQHIFLSPPASETQQVKKNPTRIWKAEGWGGGQVAHGAGISGSAAIPPEG